MACRAVLSLLILYSQSPADAFLVHRALPARPTVIGRAACPAVCVGTELQAPTARRHAAMKMSIFDKALDKGLDVILGRGGKWAQLADMSSKVMSVKTKPGEEEFCVVLEDDDEHSIDEVVRILRTSTGCSWKDALDSTLRIGRSGDAVVFRSSEGACEEMAQILCSATLKARVAPSSPENSPEAELKREREAKKAKRTKSAAAEIMSLPQPCPARFLCRHTVFVHGGEPVCLRHAYRPHPVIHACMRLYLSALVRGSGPPSRKRRQF